MAFERICVVGVGGVGGYLGGHMAYSIERQPALGRQIYFVARGPHLAAIQRNGLMLNTSKRSGLICNPTLATDNLLEIPTPDLYLVCVKSYDLDAVVHAIKKNMQPDTVILPLLNGVDIYERIRGTLADGLVLPACVYIGTHIESPGVITQRGGDGAILCGPDPELPDFDPHALSAVFEQSQLDFTWHPDPYPAIWQKYVFIAAFGLVTAHSGKTLGQTLADEEDRKQVSAIIEEIAAIARGRGIVLPDDIVTASFNKARHFPPETRTSYQRDVETVGKENEGDLFGGAIMRMGQQLGIPTPATAALYAGLR